MWNIEQEKDREKEKVGGRPVKLNEKKGDRDLEREIKTKETFFCSGGKKWEILAVTNARWKGAVVKKSEQENVQQFLHKTCN